MCTWLILTFLLGVANALTIVPRDSWGAKPPKETEVMSNPVPYVIVHHSASPAACYTKDECITAMQIMQNMHQVTNGWSDIGYSFAVGSDGYVYEGRGWSKVGAHAPGYNSDSIGICLIGNWMEALPPQNQLQALRELIEYGLDNGMIAEDYGLLGHREVRETLCPGDDLYEEISTWDHFIQL